MHKMVQENVKEINFDTKGGHGIQVQQMKRDHAQIYCCGIPLTPGIKRGSYSQACRKKKLDIIQKRSMIWNLLDFSTALLEARMQWNYTFKNFKGHSFQFGIFYLAKLSVKYQGRFTTFAGRHEQPVCLQDPHLGTSLYLSPVLNPCFSYLTFPSCSVTSLFSRSFLRKGLLKLLHTDTFGQCPNKA